MRTPTTPLSADTPRRPIEIPAGPRRRGADDDPAAKRDPASGAGTQAASAEGAVPGSLDSHERRLIVGREISLSGEISACDHLVVEGRIEAQLKDCKVIEVADGGVFKGTAEIDEAEIGGRFEGDLIVRGRLKLRGTGVISGSLSYGRIEVEVGGQLIGTVRPLDHEPAAEAKAEAETTAAPASPGPRTFPEIGLEPTFPAKPAEPS